jgi:hypothetical protein
VALIGAAIGLTVVVGLSAEIYSAARAERLDAIRALRHD